MSRPEEPIGIAPGPDYFYIPGEYIPAGGGVAWRLGFWARSQPGWEWIPARWERRADAWAFREGFWNRVPGTSGPPPGTPFPAGAASARLRAGRYRLSSGSHDTESRRAHQWGGPPGGGGSEGGRADSIGRGGQRHGTERRDAPRPGDPQMQVPDGAPAAAALRAIRSPTAESPRAPHPQRNRRSPVGGFFRRIRP